MLLNEIGTSVCHQSASRSFFLGENYLPLCSRCTGIYLGAFLTFIYFLISTKRNSSQLPSNKIIYILIGFIALMGVDVGSVMILKIRESNNYIRYFTGIFTGGALVTFLYPITNYIVWEKSDENEILKDFKDLFKFLFFLSIFYLLLILNFGRLYWFIASFSIFGIIFLYLNVNLDLLIILFKKDRKIKNIKNLIYFFPGVIALTILELYLLRLYHIWIRG